MGTAGIDKPRGGAFAFFLGHIPGHLTDFFLPQHRGHLHFFLNECPGIDRGGGGMGMAKIDNA